MGLLFSFRLAEARVPVELLDYRPERASRINRDGVTLLERVGQRKHRRIPCAADPKACTPAQVLILCVKSHDTERALRSALAALAPEGIVVSLQNGLRHVDTIRAYLSPSRTVFGTTAQGATLISPTCVRHCGSGETLLAVEEENGPSVRLAADLFCAAGIPASVVEDLPFVLWRKLLFNAAINPITSLLGIRNGQLVRIPAAWSVAQACFREARDVAVSVIGPEIAQVGEEELQRVCESTAENHSSMLQDMRRGRRTEIDAINGVIVEEGARVGKPTPVNRTLTELVRAAVEAGR